MSRDRVMALLDVRAPMGGTVREILVGAGEKVAPGQEIVVLESMKMEIPIESPAAGTVAEVFVTVSQPVEEGRPLLSIAM